MPHVNDAEFVTKILEATERDRIDWQKTAVESEFASSFGGKWILLIHKPAADYFVLSLHNAEGETVLSIDGDSRLYRIFELARRRALRVDEAIADLFKELDSR